MFSKALFSFFKKDFIYFIFRQREREGERERGKHQCEIASHTPPYGGPGWLGIESATLGFAGWRSIHWATPARVKTLFSLIMWAVCVFKLQMSSHPFSFLLDPVFITTISYIPNLKEQPYSNQTITNRGTIIPVNIWRARTRCEYISGKKKLRFRWNPEGKIFPCSLKST